MILAPSLVANNVTSITGIVGAGDVNGDGYADVGMLASANEAPGALYDSLLTPSTFQGSSSMARGAEPGTTT